MKFFKKIDEKTGIFSFFYKYRKILYYTFFYTAPIIYFYYAYKNDGGISHYWPERTDYHYVEGKKNVAFFLFFERYPTEEEVKNLRYFYRHFCDLDEDYEKYNANFFLLVYNFHFYNLLAQNIYYKKPEMNYFDYVEKKMTILKKFDYAYFLRPLHEEPSKIFCENILSERVISVDGNGVVDTALAGGTVEEFRKLNNFFRQQIQVEKELFDDKIWKEIYSIFFKENIPTKQVPIDFFYEKNE